MSKDQDAIVNLPANEETLTKGGSDDQRHHKADGSHSNGGGSDQGGDGFGDDDRHEDDDGFDDDDGPDGDGFEREDFDDDDGPDGDGLSGIDLNDDDPDDDDPSIPDEVDPAEPYRTNRKFDDQELDEFRRSNLQLLDDVNCIEAEILRTYVKSPDQNDGQIWCPDISLSELTQLCNAALKKKREKQYENEEIESPEADRFKDDPSFYECWVVKKPAGAGINGNEGRQPDGPSASLGSVTAQILTYLNDYSGPRLNECWMQGSIEHEVFELSLGERDNLICRRKT